MKTTIHRGVCEPGHWTHCGKKTRLEENPQHNKYLAFLEEQCDDSERQGKRREKGYEWLSETTFFAEGWKVLCLKFLRIFRTVINVSLKHWVRPLILCNRSLTLAVSSSHSVFCLHAFCFESLNGVRCMPRYLTNSLWTCDFFCMSSHPEVRSSSSQLSISALWGNVWGFKGVNTAAAVSCAMLLRL